MKIWLTTDKETRREIEIGDNCIIEFAGRDADMPGYEPSAIGMPWGFLTPFYDTNSRLYAIRVDTDMEDKFKFGQVSPMMNPLPGDDNVSDPK